MKIDRRIAQMDDEISSSVRHTESTLGMISERRVIERGWRAFRAKSVVIFETYSARARERFTCNGENRTNVYGLRMNTGVVSKTNVSEIDRVVGLGAAGRASRELQTVGGEPVVYGRAGGCK